MKQYGLDTKSLSFLDSYINNRYQCTKVNSCTSSELKLSYGTAQGSILGPLLFILFVNDLFEEIENRKSILMYADDTLLINNGTTVDESIVNSQKTLDIVTNCCRLNKMTINIGKTKYMIINPSSSEYTATVESSIGDIIL